MYNAGRPRAAGRQMERRWWEGRCSNLKSGATQHKREVELYAGISIVFSSLQKADQETPQQHFRTKRIYPNIPQGKQNDVDGERERETKRRQIQRKITDIWQHLRISIYQN